MANPYENIARERKALAIAVYLSGVLGDNLSMELPALRTAGHAFWWKAAELAGTTSPSQPTRDRVVEILETQVRARKNAPADPFEGATW